MIIAIDFDGTVVKHAYPLIGEDIGAISVLKELVENGHKLILWTMRSNENLLAAEHYLKSKGVELYGVNENPTQKEWTNSSKAYANLYIDDAALGIPLIIPENERPYCDWTMIRYILVSMGVIVYKKPNT